MSSDLTKPPVPIPDAPDWEARIELIRRTVAAGATSDEMELFLHIARRSGLDPLARQIHFVKRRGKGTVQVGIDGLRLVADRTGTYCGSDDAEFTGTTDGGYPAKARVTVYKMVGGLRCPFTTTARWDEFFPGEDQGFMWRKMPHTMLAKVAEAQSLRKGFPADLCGLYIHEEMEQAGISLADIEEGEVTELPKPKPARSENNPAPKPPETQPAGPKEYTAKPTGRIYEAFGEKFSLPPNAPWAEGPSDNQKKMTHTHIGKRGLTSEDSKSLRHLLCELAKVKPETWDSKGARMIQIDFLIGSSDRALSEAKAEIDKRRGQEALPS